MNDREVMAARLSEIRSGEMKEVSVGERKIFLARVGDRCYAVGANCTHYGAPLVGGALVGKLRENPPDHFTFSMDSLSQASGSLL